MKKILFPLLLLMASALSASADTPKSIAKTETMEIELDDGSTIQVEADYNVKVNVTAPIELPPKKMAIFVENNTDKAGFNRAVKSLQNQIAAQVSGKQIEIISYEDAVKAIAPLAEDNAQADIIAGKEINKFYQKKGAGGRNTTQDEKLLANTSRTRLATNMGADYVMLLSLDRFSKNMVTLKDDRFNGPQITDIYKISGTYRVLDAYTGSSIGGDAVRAEKKVRQNPGLTYEFGDFADGLEEELADEIADTILDDASEWRKASIEASGIPVRFITTANDANNQPVYFPSYDSDAIQTLNRVPVSMPANVEINGIAMGSTECTIPLMPGINKVRFTRPGYDDVTMSITPREGLSIAVNMRMTAAENERIKEAILFSHNLTKDRELNEAEVKLLEGYAEMLKNSGYRVDTKDAPQDNINIIRDIR